MNDAPIARKRFFRCGVCGADNETTRMVCENCGTEPADGPERFLIHLDFAAGECSACGEEGFPGECAKCGGQIAVPEPNEAMSARMKALGPLNERAHALVDSFEEFPEPHIAVTPSQLAFTITDADLPGRVLELIAFARNADELNLNDPSAIGGETRRAIAQALDEVERVRDWARLLSEFESDERVAELPSLVARLGRVGAVVIEKLIAALSSDSVATVADAMRGLQDALESPDEEDEIVRLLREVPTLGTPDDVNARVALVTGREGDYTDELGLPNPVAIFAAPPGEKSSFSALAEGASHYLSHLLDTPNLVQGHHAMVALPAVELALLDRPFEHHRRAELMRDLLRHAAAKDAGALEKALAEYDDRGGNAFETSMRVRRKLRLLATGDVEGPIDVIESAVEAYRQLAEGHFRTTIRCALSVRAATEGKKSPPESLLLGDIEGLLSGWHDELGRSLDGIIERHIRNAEAHQEYRVDVDTEEIVLKDGMRMTVDQLAARMEDLTGAIAAIDAAIACHTVDTDRSTSPRWLINGESPRLAELIMRTVAAGLGAAVERLTVEQGTVKILLPEGSDIASEKAQTLIWAARPIVPSATLFEVYEGHRLVSASGSEIIDRWGAATPTEQPFLTIEARYESAIRCGADEAEALRDAIALAVRFAIGSTVRAFSTPLKPQEIKSFEQRLRAVTRLASRHGAGKHQELRKPLAVLRHARDSLKDVAKSVDAARRFNASLDALNDWANEHKSAPVSEDEH